MSIVGPVTFLAVGFALMAGVSHAQYPPQGPIVLAATQNTNVSSGGTTEITGQVIVSGQPASGVPAEVAIVEEPEGSDSALGSKSVTRITNSHGIVTADLYVGTVPGVLVIEITSEGASSSVIVVVEGDEPLPPQSAVNGITPPNTGSGGLAH